MPNGIKYVLMATIFLVLTKILQLTAFDSQRYEKLQRESASAGYSVYSTKTRDKKDQKQGKSSEKEVVEKPSKAESESQNVERTLAESTDSSTPKNYDIVTLSSLKNSYLAPLLAKIPEGQLREDIVIRYYRHEKDLKKVDKLKELSYYIHEKEAEETAGLGSNIIYYGDDVPLEDIQIIAFTLLEEGIPLKSIQHTKFEWKAQAIEIGTDTMLLDEPNMSTQEIQDFHKQYIGN